MIFKNKSKYFTVTPKYKCCPFIVVCLRVHESVTADLNNLNYNMNPQLFAPELELSSTNNYFSTLRKTT